MMSPKQRHLAKDDQGVSEGYEELQTRGNTIQCTSKHRGKNKLPS